MLPEMHGDAATHGVQVPYIKAAVFSSLPDGAQALAVAELAASGTVLHVARDDARMARLFDALRFFAPDIEIIAFPAWDCLPYDRVSPNPLVISRRMEALARLLSPQIGKRVVLTTVNAVTQRVLAREIIASVVLCAAAGKALPRDQLTGFLIRNGYVNAGTVNEPGEFAVRGSIVDIFPSGAETPYRLDFFADDLEAIRSFDPLSQISGGKVSEILLRPASEILLDAGSIERFRRNYHALFGAVTQEDPLYEDSIAGRRHAGQEHWQPLFYERMETLFDYAPEAAMTLDHLADEARGARAELIRECYRNRTADGIGKNFGGPPYKPIPPELLYVSDKAWDTALAERKVTEFHPFSLPPAGEEKDIKDAAIKPGRNFTAEATAQNVSVFDLLHNYLKRNSDKKIVIACVSEGSRSRLMKMLEEREIAARSVAAWTEVDGNTPTLAVLGMEQGFESTDIACIAEQDLLGEKLARASKKRKPGSHFFSEAATLCEGELVAHKEYGIGRFERLETVAAGGTKHDCLLLTYDGGDRLYVPVENSDLVTRYGSSDEETPLDKLGGVSWQRRKARMKKRIQVSAGELLKIAAARRLHDAEIFEHNSFLYQEFCARFPYPETEDQLQSIADVENDLHSGHPMDRLICGDVGFGKTEVALRAAFIAAQPAGEGQVRGQVAVITPTTLLARQHYQTFTRRFSGLPFAIHQLSRLAVQSEAKKTHEMLKEGTVDIIIGTHALLAKSVMFRKLALLIVDEEQHFGVAQKEKLKKFRAETHVLTLTATPIPRTLQMSLTGIRDLSLITTPPIDRLAVRTYVTPFDPVVVREAILREHYRGGSTFYVCPRISDLAEVKARLKELAPEVKIAVAHGQLPAAELDAIMQSFSERAFDILLCTSIVESGIDIPHANTLIVHRADMFGLAQLYQLRGRVGRAKLRAYAYLTLPPRRMPTKQAMKRLEVMQKLDNLGAGFTLASHDMDIRGFGNLLGDEQSGHVKEVGVELYQQMLEEEVARLKGEEGQSVKRRDDFSPQINLGMTVLLPETYVSDLSLRLGLYRRIADISEEGEVEAMAVEMTDRFGTLPPEVENLLKVVKLKLLCKQAGVAKVDAGPKGMVLAFRDNHFSNPEALISYITKNPLRFKLRADQTLVIADQGWENDEKRLKGVNETLEEVAKLAG